MFQIATNSETTVNEIAEKLVSILADAGIDNVNLIRTASRLGDVKRNFSDVSKATKVLGVSCEWNLESGLQSTIDWYIRKKP